MSDSSIVPGWICRRAGAFFVVVAAVSLGSSAALADQFVVVDSTWDHTPDLADSHYRVVPTAATPADWKSPIDYASGMAHVRLEVFTKPTDTPTKFQACPRTGDPRSRQEVVASTLPVGNMGTLRTVESTRQTHRGTVGALRSRGGH